MPDSNSPSLLKHSSIYAIGQILARMASILLLPLYTHCLSPKDYGAVAILDITAGLLSLVIGSGLSSAVTRSHYQTESESERDTLWWTGLFYVLGIGTLLILPFFLLRENLAELTLGDDIPQGGRLYAIALTTLWVMVLGEYLDAYVRALKWSGVYVAVSMSRLLVNITANVLLLVYFGWGITGLLIGNLIANTCYLIVLFCLFCATRRQIGFDRLVLWRILAFGSPLVATALLQLLMHESDRYLLRAYLPLEQVGYYSLAHKIAQAVNSLSLIPFASIWGVALYEIGRQPNYKQEFARIFEYFISAVLVLMLGAALTSGPLLPLLATEDYRPAVGLIPIILLGFLCFALHSQFNVTALLAGKTLLTIPPCVIGVVVNFTANLILIPRFGAVGAAWAAVLTYSSFALSGLVIYRQIDVIPYPFVRTFIIALGIVQTYLLFQRYVVPNCSEPAQLLLSVLICGVWAFCMFIQPIVEYLGPRWMLARGLANSPSP